jgi:hypothetical protein
MAELLNMKYQAQQCGTETENHEALHRISIYPVRGFGAASRL